MNTDFFGKEERKQMLERIERIELANRATTTSIASINEKLIVIGDMIAGKSEATEKSSFEAVTAMPAPSYNEIQERRDAEFKARMDEMHKDGDAKFEAEMGVLREIRSGIAETNSLLSAILKKMEEPKPYVPPIDWTKSPNGTGGIKFTNTIPKGTTGGPPSDISCDAKQYIPTDQYGDGTTEHDISQLEPKPYNYREG